MKRGVKTKWNKNKGRGQVGRQRPLGRREFVEMLTETDAEYKLRLINERIRAYYGTPT